MANAPPGRSKSKPLAMPPVPVLKAPVPTQIVAPALIPPWPLTKFWTVVVGVALQLNVRGVPEIEVVPANTVSLALPPVA